MADDDKRDGAEESQDDFDLLNDDEEIDLEALLADDDTGAAAPDVGDAADRGEPNTGDDTDAVVVVDDIEGAAAAAAAVEEKPKSTKASKKKREKAAKPKKKREKAPKPAKARKKAAPKAPPKISGRAYAFVCSECYDEYWLPGNYSQETVTCAECLHVGKKPDENFLRTVAMHKQGEKRAFAAVALCGLLLGLAVFGLVWLNSLAGEGIVPPANRDLVNYSLMGGGGLLAILFIWLLVRFEGNRWEVYF